MLNYTPKRLPKLLLQSYLTSTQDYTKTVQTRDMVKGDNTVSGSERLNPGSNRHYLSGRLMPVDTGRGQQVVLDLLEVGVADAAALHSHQKFARSNDGYGDRLDAHSAVALVDGSVHGVTGGARRRACQDIPPIWPLPLEPACSTSAIPESVRTDGAKPLSRSG